MTTHTGKHKMRTHTGKRTETMQAQMHTNALFVVCQWTKALDLFCEDEFSVKTRHYHCCKLKPQARSNCFETEAPNPSYGPTTHYSGPELLPRGSGFTFTNNCPRSENQIEEGFVGGGVVGMGEWMKAVDKTRIARGDCKQWERIIAKEKYRREKEKRNKKTVSE